MANPRLKLKIGSRVETLDGMFGHVSQVILNPRQKKVVGLVVRAGLLPPRTWVVPASLIDDVNEERVKLRVSRENVLDQPEFDPAQFLPIAREELGYQEGESLVSVHGGAGSSDELALSAAHQRAQTKTAQTGLLEGDTVSLSTGQKIWATDGNAGHVDMLLLDASGPARTEVVERSA